MEALLRWREPAVIVLLVVVAVRELLVVGFAVAALVGAADPYGQAGYQAAGDAAEPVALVLLALLLVSCHASPATRRARLLTVLGLVSLAVGLVVQLVVAVLGLATGDSGLLPQPFGVLNGVERLLGLVVPALALLTLAVLLRRPASSPEVVEQPALTATTEAAPDEAGPDPALQPTWQPDVAAGAAWLSAGDAASGRPPAAATPVGDQDQPHPWATGPR